MAAAPGTAVGAPAELSFSELRALDPDARCFTGSPLLERAGIPPAGDLTLEPTPPGARGGEYDVLDIGDVSLVAGPWTFTPGVPETLSGDHVIASLNAFLGAHEDEYDFVALYVTETTLGPFWTGVANDIEGIGLPIFDTATPNGFPDLEGYLYLDSIYDYPDDVRASLFFGQEIGHRWAAYADRTDGGRDMRGRDDTHWNFYLSTSNSPMEGNAWVEGPPGQFSTDHMAPVAYSPLDRYLMGFLPPAEVPDWFLIGDPQVVANPVEWPTEAGSAPYYGVRATDPAGAPGLGPIVVEGERIDIALDDVIAEHGPRSPDWEDAPRGFRMAVVLMMPASAPVTFDDYLATEALNDRFATLWGELVDGEAHLDRTLGTSAVHAIDLVGLGAGPTWESTFDPTTATGVPAGGCTAHIGGTAAPWALVLLLTARAGRRRRELSGDRAPSP